MEHSRAFLRGVVKQTELPTLTANASDHYVVLHRRHCQDPQAGRGCPRLRRRHLRQEPGNAVPARLRRVPHMRSGCCGATVQPRPRGLRKTDSRREGGWQMKVGG